MTEEEQKAEVAQNPDTEKLWKRFKSYFWVLFVLHLIPKGFSGIETTTNEQATTLFFVALGITLLVALGMVINVGLHAYLFSKKKVYALLGLLGLWWAGVVGIALAYFAVQWVYYKSINKPFPLSTKIIGGALAIISLLLMFSLGSTFFSLSGISNDSTSTTSQTQEWATIETRRGDLSVLLPSNPVYESDKTQNTIEHYAYTATDSDGTIYLVKYENFAEIARETGVDLVGAPDSQKRDVLKAWADSDMEEFDVQNLSSEFKTVKGYPAIQYTGKLIDGRESVNLKSVLVLINEAIYSFVVLYKNGNSEQLDRVVNSASFNSLGL
ncbi:MAG: hypothetical protein A2931_03485 [Candidatus Niyogibacteria bacterium RIFCSPLOWO2_01_FULL_45_48]|uniref:Uncharacterized protein n=1 Tax=Candidatus Niyogibacteria bacterium RIFCSPLOWO2_01_FULL_45_48 TaxID=1801724 RepID=A0A1G2EZ19_9BACT|nr:MAG: hypothetical protein A2931_03485 [Candidatus Niyogibacteria bacterium RIFCSPLOWO2_01_FULL_45_48]